MSTSDWKNILRKTFTKITDLADFLELTAEQRKQLIDPPHFVLKVPFRLAQKMAKGTLDDPLVRQFLPLKSELERHPLFVKDPVCDATFQQKNKLFHKYQGRVLLTVTGACAMHCRFCFRQHFPYADNKLFSQELSYIAEDESIQEVILSGGDPLSLPNQALGEFLQQLGCISHVRRIRFHTRFPIGIPERIDEEFLDLLKQVPQQIFFIIHCNHSRELDEDIYEKFRHLRQIGCVLMNQAVLLKGVNDDVQTLLDLAHTLANHGILFYYLHQLDRVQGAAHFEVDEKKGLWLVDQISQQLSGYAVPKYVKEIAGESNKTQVSTSYQLTEHPKYSILA